MTSVTIPNSVSSIADGVFYECTNLTDVTIPDSVTVIRRYAFYFCTSLTSITIPNHVTIIGASAFYSCTSLTSVTIGNSVAVIEGFAFGYCTSLTSITIPSSVISLESEVFYFCTSLTEVYFQGNAPRVDSGLFYNATVYYLPGTTGWGPTFGGIPTALWSLPNPLILENSPSFGVKTNRFGFIISWAANTPVVVEACTNLVNAAWSPLRTNTLTGGWAYFSDPQWTNHPVRFYRLRSP